MAGPITSMTASRACPHSIATRSTTCSRSAPRGSSASSGSSGRDNPSPQPPPRNGEGEQATRYLFFSPSPLRGGGWGEGFPTKQVSATLPSSRGSPLPPQQPTEAASVLLTRGPGSSEVFLIRRSEALRFFGGFWAFPGGKVDRRDAAIPLQPGPPDDGLSLRRAT